MILGFIFSHLNAIILGMWLGFFAVVLVRFLRPYWVKNISYKQLILVAAVLHLLYATFITWGQYYIWSTSSDFTRALLAAPLPIEAPLPVMLEWIRPYFGGTLGYFTYYAFGRFFLSVIILFVVTGIFYAIFKFWHARRNNFGIEGPELLCVLMLIAGWPGVVVLGPLGFAVAILFSVSALVLLKKTQTSLLPAFLVVTPIALIAAKPILDFLHLYALLKI
ncbi:MAG: hypothetical protein A2481_00225 [Candidatus Yonathbacteria bacterium RIFOXYC2_FULL_47_9]|nr:MAG: hypothetical protein A2481_00225 [Candidatus Yonathbacteria bacterium RIFOXYC2_FULL_47_9]HAT68619.1 hypothetical protein [Candidatus Yonathbacteria bacterium]